MTTENAKDAHEAGSPRSSNTLIVQPGPARLMDAIERLLRSDRRRAERFMRFARDSRMSLEHIWCAIDDKGNILSTVLASPSPGRTALLFASSPNTPGEANEIGNIIDAVCRGLRDADVGLAQALVEPDDELELDAFLHGGLDRLATLTYMERPVPNRRSTFNTTLPDGVRIEPFSLEHRGELERLLEETYKETLDCPGLAGLRNPRDVVDGHMSAGVFKPEWWMIAREGSRAIGVMLLNGSSGSGSIELVYLGIVPDVRGRGIGQVILNHGLQLIAGSREHKIVLAVDEANAPALGMYEQTGFERTVRRAALVRCLDQEGTTD
jgi:ribosomal protein S18 acetylase RimI-like enzyme